MWRAHSKRGQKHKALHLCGRQKKRGKSKAGDHAAAKAGSHAPRTKGGQVGPEVPTETVNVKENSEYFSTVCPNYKFLFSPTHLLCGGKSSESSPSLVLLWKGLQDSTYSNAHGMIYLGKGTEIHFVKV